MYGDYHSRSTDPGTFAQLWRTLADACRIDRMREIESAMEVADAILGGHGVELLREFDDERAGYEDPWGYYVNMGDTYATTLVWLSNGPRFVVASYGEIIEAWERARERRARLRRR